MLLLIGFVLLLVLDSPWNWIAFFACVILFTFEITFFWRRVRGRQVQAGSETLIGKHAKVVAACRPLGQVVVGERWEARCADGADTGETVTILSAATVWCSWSRRSVTDEELDSDQGEP